MSSRGKAGCGCGCGSAGGAGCSCEVESSGSCGSGPFVRPRFFGGQLLTEDDLQELVEYVVAKNRLHNRVLFGDGVVCGLMVNCDPCGGSKVVVQPGYALDCCGNDIVVECPVTIDIHQMIRELRQKRLGKDCGDPCRDVGGSAPKPSDPRPSDPRPSDPRPSDPRPSDPRPSDPRPAPNPIPSPAEPAPLFLRLSQSGAGEQSTPEKPPPEEYCLYVRYCESAAEPVTPYATDDCSASACQHTRTREGYEFELRCKTADAPARSIAEALRYCRPELNESGTLEQAALLHRIVTPIRVAGGLLNKPVQFTTDDATALASARTALSQKMVKTALSEAEVVDGIFMLIELGALTARQQMAPGSDAQLFRAHAAAVPMTDAVAYFTAQVGNVKQPLAQTFAREALQFLEAPPDDLVQQRAFANGALLTHALLEAAVEPARRLYAALRERALSGGGAQCALNDRVVRLPAPHYVSSKLDVGRAIAFSSTVSEIAVVSQAYEASCSCDALNPPCAECEDTAVLLACIEWQDCKVTDICNVKRKWVITGPNLRYWVPQIGKTGQRLERLCCPDPCDPVEPDPITGGTGPVRPVLGSLVSATSVINDIRGRILNEVLLPGFAPELDDVRRRSAVTHATLAAVPAASSGAAAVPASAAAAPAVPHEWKALLDAAQARLEQLVSQNTELTERVGRLEARKK